MPSHPLQDLRNPDEPTELQPRTIRSVEVPTVQDKQALYVAR
ncbi:hypothetical protein AZE42_06233 [Rhizopogon vesiculosus]|uniref:Uncharacterized protein n=1 Tax=Rhizopogon vesiculosus TaxID=180088 RepID=A0A1J8QZ50_9AGAM|nr:hypothetical protein AZE42_06233 [Rhizopogon vesiculosus]